MLSFLHFLFHSLSLALSLFQLLSISLSPYYSFFLSFLELWNIFHGRQIINFQNYEIIKINCPLTDLLLFLSLSLSFNSFALSRTHRARERVYSLWVLPNVRWTVDGQLQVVREFVNWRSVFKVVVCRYRFARFRKHVKFANFHVNFLVKKSNNNNNNNTCHKSTVKLVGFTWNSMVTADVSDVKLIKPLKRKL